MQPYSMKYGMVESGWAGTEKHCSTVISQTAVRWKIHPTPSLSPAPLGSVAAGAFLTATSHLLCAHYQSLWVTQVLKLSTFPKAKSLFFHWAERKQKICVFPRMHVSVCAVSGVEVQNLWSILGGFFFPVWIRRIDGGATCYYWEIRR